MPLIALNSWPCSCTLELTQGHHVACRFALRPGKHSMQLCFFRPRLRVGGYTEVPANTLLGLFQLLGLGEVTVSTALVRGPWSAACCMKPRTHVPAACDLWVSAGGFALVTPMDVSCWMFNFGQKFLFWFRSLNVIRRDKVIFYIQYF